jgi:exonuclease SbcC
VSFRLKSLVVEDFRSIRGTQHLSLDAPAVLIHGPNGTGKTSLLSAIEFGLTGAVASFSRFDPDYLQHLPHKKSPTGKCRVAIEVDGLAHGTAEVIGDGVGVKGGGLLTGDLLRFFTERCYLPQASLGRLLEIYEHQDSRRSDSPLTRFVKELLGLEALDALIDGLHASGDVRRFRDRAPMFWAARAGAGDLADRAKAAEESVAAFRAELAEVEEELREELGQPADGVDPLDLTSLAALAEAEIETIETRLQGLARRRRDLAAAGDQLTAALAGEADGQREAAELASSTARTAFSDWQADFGARLQTLFAAIRTRMPGLPETGSDTATTHAAAVQFVDGELQRLQAQANRDAADEKALSEVEESLRQGAARLAVMEAELQQDKGANQELAQALTAISSHIQNEKCPVCGRDFSEVSEAPLAAHVSEEVQRLIAAAGRVQALVRDRSTTSAAVTQAQRRKSELTARQLTVEQKDANKVELARFAEWKTSLIELAAGAALGARLQRDVASTARQLSVVSSRQAGISGLRGELVQHAEAVGLPAPADDVPLQNILEELTALVESQTAAQQNAMARHERALASVAEVTDRRVQLDEALEKLDQLNGEMRLSKARRDEAERQIATAKDLAGRAQALRTEKVVQVFNDELNAVWRELFIRLAPDEEFVPAFALPKSASGGVEAVLETLYRSGGKGGNPRAMLSAGNLNTAALTLFLALNLSVKPLLPCLIIDDPVQSMDDVHIAQFAALLRTLKQEGRQVILAVHDRQLFDYLALELSPTYNGDRLITIELGRNSDGMTTAPWTPTVYEPDRAIAA